MKVEFYFDNSGYFQKKIYVKIGTRIWEDYDNLSVEEIETMFDQTRKLSKRAHAALLHLSQFISGKKEILRQFIFCNWTALDNRWDISDRNLCFENVQCPHKHTGNCPYNGKSIVCLKNSK